jgi:hypothetical protein
MVANTTEAKLLAHALYEIRILLAPYLGSTAEGPLNVRIAAHLAYALHNEAFAIMERQNFDLEKSLAKIKAIDTILNVQDGSRFLNTVMSDSS